MHGLTNDVCLEESVVFSTPDVATIQLLPPVETGRDDICSSCWVLKAESLPLYWTRSCFCTTVASSDDKNRTGFMVRRQRWMVIEEITYNTVCKSRGGVCYHASMVPSTKSNPYGVWVMRSLTTPQTDLTLDSMVPDQSTTYWGGWAKSLTFWST